MTESLRQATRPLFLCDFASLREILLTIVFAILLPPAIACATEPPITSVAFAPGGQIVVASSQSGVHLYSWPQLQQQRTIKASASNLHCVRFADNGKLLAVAGGNPTEDGIVEVFSWPSGESIVVLDEHLDSVMDVAWSSGNRILTASLDREISLLDLDGRTVLGTFSGHSRGVSSLCLLNDGKTLVSAGDDQSVRVWDVESGELIRSLSQHTGPIHALALRPYDEGLPMVASAAGDRTIRFWQPTIGRMVRYLRLDAVPLSIAWLNPSQIAAACVDGQVRFINADEVKITHQVPAIDAWAYAIAVHPSDHSIVVGGPDGQIRRIVLE